MRLRAVSFDAAGTLFHPARGVGALYAMVAERHGVQIDPAELHARFQRAFAAAPPLAFPPAPAVEVRAQEKGWWRAVVSRVFAGVTFPDFDAYFEDLFAFFASPSAWRRDPDALDLLGAIRAEGMAILVVSNFDARLRTVMEALSLAPAVDRVVISSEAGAAKPDPRIFEVALQATGLAANEVLHVGDTAREDLVGARAAGLPVVLVGSAPLVREAPDAEVVSRLGDVAQVLARFPR